jgi:DnaJ-class molecular chaperone
MIYLEAKRKLKCKACKGLGYTLIEGYEYICSECKGMKYKLKNVLVDIETLSDKIGEILDARRKESPTNE